MTNRKWHKGPPPHAGWWNASTMHDPYCWRWWDGERWSRAVSDLASSKHAASRAEKPAERIIQKSVKWTDYWPKNARVPRVKQ